MQTNNTRIARQLFIVGLNFSAAHCVEAPTAAQERTVRVLPRSKCTTIPYPMAQESLPLQVLKWNFKHKREVTVLLAIKRDPPRSIASRINNNAYALKDLEMDEATSRFKVGDRVRALRRDGFPDGTVVQLLNNGFLLVRWNGHLLETAHGDDVQRIAEE